MLIYELKDGVPYVTQIVRGFNNDKVTTHKTSFDKIDVVHIAERVSKLRDIDVYVIGDTSKAGNGLKLKEKYTHYLRKAL